MSSSLHTSQKHLQSQNTEVMNNASMNDDISLICIGSLPDCARNTLGQHRNVTHTLFSQWYHLGNRLYGFTDSIDVKWQNGYSWSVTMHPPGQAGFHHTCYDWKWVWLESRDLFHLLFGEGPYWAH